ncbi:type II secretion system protein N [Cupriavidus basilensis]|uniref:type II secretion system protein N n=1 Tax=Cupriavidus basilensis TaxID=68895 RepID=UPI001F267E69|nr:type II secretion system protein N [Cupriavidus basilensis]MCP3023325.1 general secretion pathway protein [Cupriavidus basilensis]MDR3383138.1 general secretion pathway protein [Cupriavidus basilensis]
MQLSLRPALRFNPSSLWLPRLAALVLFVALCALATRWALTFSAMQTIAVPNAARVAQTEAVETGAAGTLFGGNAQSGVRDVQLIGVVADIGSGAGAAIVSLDGGPAKAVRAGTALSPQIRLTEVRDRGVVIERNGVRQEIALPVPAIVTRGPAAATQPALPAGAAAPLSTPMPVPATPIPAPPPQSLPQQQSQGGNEPISAKD